MQRPCYLSERGVEPWQLQDFWPRPTYGYPDPSEIAARFHYRSHHIRLRLGTSLGWKPSRAVDYSASSKARDTIVPPD
jgi:hypothetical protein